MPLKSRLQDILSEEESVRAWLRGSFKQPLPRDLSYTSLEREQERQAAKVIEKILRAAPHKELPMKRALSEFTKQEKITIGETFQRFRNIMMRLSPKEQRSIYRVLKIPREKIQLKGRPNMAPTIVPSIPNPWQMKSKLKKALGREPTTAELYREINKGTREVNR